MEKIRKNRKTYKWIYSRITNNPDSDIDGAIFLDDFVNMTVKNPQSEYCSQNMVKYMKNKPKIKTYLNIKIDMFF